MNLFTNSFRCSSRDDGSEFVIEFFQESPHYNEDGELSGVDRERVTSVVMSTEKAALLSLLIESTPTVEKHISLPSSQPKDSQPS